VLHRKVSAVREYFPALTGLRFFLALWVMLHHIAGRGMMLEAWTKSLPAPAKRLILGGYLAVQTFFILSGFVLATTYRGALWTGPDLKKYFAARFARIYPLYALSLLVVSPFIIDSMMRPTRTVAHKTGLLVNYALVLQGWFGNLGVGWNTPAWTLTCEFFFYLSFPLVFPWLGRAGRKTQFAVLAVSLAMPVVFDHAGVPWHWKPLYHFFDFASGIAAARLFEIFQWRKLRSWAAILYFPALLAGALLIVNPWVMDLANYRGWGGDVNSGLRPLNVIALLGLALGTGLGARLLASQLVEYLGKASYSMYILHVPVLWWYNKWAMYQTAMPQHVAAALYFVIVMAVSALAFELVEKPANRWIRRRAASVRPPQLQPL
jgi:peptidoglycan/LPS O-acetylase OafA/YrhL